MRRPHPLVALEDTHRQQAKRFSKREDRFSQLLSRVLTDEHHGQYLVTRGGLSRAEHDELLRTGPEAHEAFRLELRAAVDRLRELLTAGDPLYIAAVVLFENVFSSWGEFYEPTHEGSEAKVELVSGLVATQPPNQIDERPTPGDMQAILDELDHVIEVGVLFNLSKPPGEDPAVATLQFAGVTRWMCLRGDSFTAHGRELAQEVYRPHADWLLRTYGFAVDDVIAVGGAAVGLMTQRLNDLLRDGTEAGNRAATQHGPADDPGLAAAAAMAAVQVVESGIRGAMSFTANDLTRFDPTLEPTRVEALLNELSIEVGSLKPSDYTGLYDESPLRERPFLARNGEYLLPVPGMLERDLDGLLERRLLTGRPGFSSRRAKTLDRLAVGYLGSMLPGAATYTNLFYENTELDGLVLFEDIAIVVEGKGGEISLQARRGDLRRLQRDVEGIVEEAWQQGARARAYLLGQGQAVFSDESRREVLRLPVGAVREVIIVNPTLHELAGHGPQLGRLRALGLFPGDELPWSVYINDLRVIAETCDNAAVFLHYLVWRARLPLGQGVVVWDEIDLWASYLLCERFGVLDDGDMVMVANSSTDFDAYYDGLAGRGPRAKRPGKFLKEPVRSFVAQMAEERPPGWREAAGACLDLSIPELAVIAVKASEIARRAASQGGIVWYDLDRVALMGLPPAADPRTALADFQPPFGDPTLLVAAQIRDGKRVEVVWAGYRKAVSFELSAFEQAVSEAGVTSPFGSTEARP